ncbi:Molybdenum cofactor sulfurase [Paramyrothecium foliicola]|nr:Molybdenum cofactor sulfurase [Paramyrothecium foliicola]
MAFIIIFLLSLCKSLLQDSTAFIAQFWSMISQTAAGTGKMASPDTGYNTSVERFRQREYPAIQGNTFSEILSRSPRLLRITDSVYLDHAGTTLPAKSLMTTFAAEMTTALYGNPHSLSESSQLSTRRVEDVRLRLLQFFKADPEKFDLVFVPNATAGVKLVLEGVRALPGGYLYAYHEACHTSIVGVREEAKHSVCVDDSAVNSWIDGKSPFESLETKASATLFSYTAQSHMDGRRYPVTWSRQLKKRYVGGSMPFYTLLDVASFAATAQLDLSHPDFTADFVVLSLYKIFGFPNLGALIVRRSAASIFDHRKFFGGGTVDMVICRKEQWHASKTQSLHDRLEDGTLPFHSIVAAGIALDVHKELFGSMSKVRAHTNYLASRLHNRLNRLRHRNGEPVCVLYTAVAGGTTPLGVGPIVSFNLLNSAGAWVSLGEFEKLAALKQIHIRTGSLCSPGGTAAALGLTAWELKRLHAAGFRCGSDNDIVAGKPTGVIRASLGAMSTEADIDRFIGFVEEFFVDYSPPKLVESLSEAGTETNHSQFSVKAITVYPIKSCGGFAVPKDVAWEVRAEGLAWDREWCLVHKLSGQALSQKRYPKMAHLHPTLDFDCGVLRVRYEGPKMKKALPEITVPLSPDVLPNGVSFKETASQVCGDEVSALMYCSDEVNDFFTEVLGVSCALARFPVGGADNFSRLMKLDARRPQGFTFADDEPQTASDIPTPPGSDSGLQDDRRLLLSNESPILMIHQASVDALNQEIMQNGGGAVSETVFRANIVIGEGQQNDSKPKPYSEDDWESISIGSQNFELLGPCQRCHMVCVNPKTGEKGQEPYITLAKTRRSNGKVFFGMHMRHDAPSQKDSKDPVVVEASASSSHPCSLCGAISNSGLDSPVDGAIETVGVLLAKEMIGVQLPQSRDRGTLRTETMFHVLSAMGRIEKLSGTERTDTRNCQQRLAAPLSEPASIPRAWAGFGIVEKRLKPFGVRPLAFWAKVLRDPGTERTAHSPGQPIFPLAVPAFLLFLNASSGLDRGGAVLDAAGEPLAGMLHVLTYFWWSRLWSVSATFKALSVIMVKLSLAVLPLLLQGVIAAPGALLDERAECEPTKTVTVYVRSPADDGKAGGPTAASGPLQVNAASSLSDKGDKSPTKKPKEGKKAPGGSVVDDFDGEDLGSLPDPYPTPTGSRSHKGGKGKGDQLSTLSEAVGRRNVVYFPNWSIYGAGYSPQDLPADQITHLLYAFADIKTDGEVVSSDPNSDVVKRFATDQESPTENNAYGCVKQVYLLKKRNRKMKTLLSIGGWTYSQQGKFQNAAKDETSRKRFASSAVKLVADWGMDGIDIDWEYPKNDEEARQFVQLLTATREALDQYALDNKQRYRYLLTIAASANPKNYDLQLLEEMDPLLDAWHLMAYDYAGDWDKTTGNQANLYPDPNNKEATKFNTEEALAGYLARGIPASKIVLGLPLYGRSFLETTGLGAPFVGMGEGSIDKGIWLFRDLPRPGANVHFNVEVGATHSYDAKIKELVSFDDDKSAKLKAEYIQSRGLGGAVFWEASGDKSGDESLVRIMATDLGQLESSDNYLDFPQSQYDNIRKSMPS